MSLRDLFLQESATLQLREQQPLSPSAPGRPTIKSLNFSHEAIIRWMLANPSRDLGECAREFNYTQSWLSIIIHSDAFQAKYAELNGNADALVVADIPAKMRGIASMALEGLGDQIEMAVQEKTIAPRDFLLKTSEALLKSLGYGQKQTVNINAHAGATTNVVDADTLHRARAKMLENRANSARVVDGESERVADTST